MISLIEEAIAVGSRVRVFQTYLSRENYLLGEEGIITRELERPCLGVLKAYYVALDSQREEPVFFLDEELEEVNS